MRILFLAGEHPDVPGLTGGIGSFTADASRALADAGHEVHVLVCAPGLDRQDRDRAGVSLHVRGLLPGLRWARGQIARQLALSLSTGWHARGLGRFDAIEAPEWQAMAAGVSVVSRPRLLVCLQTPRAVIASYDDSFRPPGRFEDWLERWTVRRAAAVVSLSELLVRELRAKDWLASTTPVDVAPALVHLSDWSDAPDPLVAGSGARLVGVGRVEPRKRFELLVDVAAQLRDLPDLAVEILGESTGPEADALRQRAERLGVTLHLVGRLPRAELRDKLARASAMVIPSRFDSFNLAGLEALAMGVPVVTTDRVGLGELADGSEGLQVAASDATSLAAALRPILLDDGRRTDASRAARAIAAGQSPQHFADDRVARYRRLSRAAQ